MNKELAYHIFLPAHLLLAVSMHENGDEGLDVPAYTDTNISTKVIKIIQSYTGIVNKMVWRKA